jgi:hypothetical protein
VDVSVTDAWAPDKDPELWDGEDLTWHTQKAKTVGLYRALNQLSSIMLLDDLRGYPPNDPSRLPTATDVAVAYDQTRSVVVALSSVSRLLTDRSPL